jgi:DNA-binding YbaB/EbfC family protein
MPRGFSGMNDLLRQAQKMQHQMAEVQESLKDRVVDGTAGGGMVRVLVNGKQEVVAVKIDPQVIEDSDTRTLVEDLVLAATRQGFQKAKDMAQEEMNKVTGGINLPGMV